LSQFENGKESVELGLVLKTLLALGLHLDVSKQTADPFSEGLLRR
jgi:hypothetical protein